MNVDVGLIAELQQKTVRSTCGCQLPPAAARSSLQACRQP